LPKGGKRDEDQDGCGRAGRRPAGGTPVGRLPVAGVAERRETGQLVHGDKESRKTKRQERKKRGTKKNTKKELKLSLN